MLEGFRVAIVPEPKKMVLGEKTYSFSGFYNLPENISTEFSIPNGEWMIKNIDRQGTGLIIKDKEISIWGNKHVCYATLVQIFMQCKTFLPEIEIEESFNFRYRGYHIDMARGGVPKVETLKHIIRMLFLCKFNWFALYLEDLFPWEKYPEIGRHRGRFTKQELNNVIDYGGKLGIDVFPALELLGHMERILSMPEFCDMNEWYHSTEGVINISDENARQFTYDLLDEVLQFSKSDFICIGGDETVSLGRGRSMNKNFKFEGPELFEKHYATLIDMCIKSGKQPIIYADMLNGLYMTEEERGIWRKVSQSKIWDDVWLVNWYYIVQPPEFFKGIINDFGERKSKQLACPAFRSDNGYYPDFTTTIGNMKNFFEAAREENLPGYMITSWGDGGQECLFSFNDPFYLAAAEIAEGNDGWEEKWLAITGESNDVLEARNLLGKANFANNMKNLFIDKVGLQDICFLWGGMNDIMTEKEKIKIADQWESMTAQINENSLPEDMKLVYTIAVTVMKKLRGCASPTDYMEIAKTYADLWLNERKPDGLELIISRIYGQAGLLKLKLPKYSS